MMRLIAFLTVLLLWGWAAVSAQPLADLAKKERKRRKENEASQVKSFDESDLRSRGIYLTPPVASPAEEEGAPISQSEEPAEEEEEPDPEKTEAFWRNRLAPIDRRIADIRSRLNAPGFSEDPTNLARRQRLERDLDRALADRQAVLDEARKKGVPPGWLR